MSKTQIIPEGALFVITEGEYSDYGLRSLMRATVEIDVPAVWDEWAASGVENEYGNTECVGIEHWLVNVKGIAVELPLHELRMGYNWKIHKWGSVAGEDPSLYFGGGIRHTKEDGSWA